MKGIVEIYSDGELLYSEDNLIVDGAGELIANIMTIPSSIGNIAATSSILDVSNYTIRSLSFGKATGLYNKAGHSPSSLAVSGRESNQIWVVGSSVSTSSFTPDASLPQDPSPLDTLLERDSSGLNSFGQNINFIPYGTLVSGTAASACLASGCFAPASGINAFLKLADGTTITSTIYGPYSGTFNLVSSMDWRGFVNFVSGSNPLSGLVVSSSSSFSSTGELGYRITITSGDVGCANLYGGIYTLGLWYLDLSSMLAAGRLPPYTFHPYTNVLNYKLFSKKTFLLNICQNQDSAGVPGFANPRNIQILWRLKFL